MLVSVIIPIYNAEKYLEKCIQSVINQSFTDFELLLINDGSTDSSGAICDKYALADTRIKVFHKENAGVSSARNLGIENAKGTWITFIDSDDLIESNYFDVLSEATEADLILQGFKYFDAEKIVKEHTYRNETLTLKEFIDNYQLYPDFSSACSKFYNAKLVRQHLIHFSNQLKYGEDTLFNLKYVTFCKDILLKDTTPYLYRLSETGLSSTKSNYVHDKLFYEESRNELTKFNNEAFYNQSIRISLSRLIHSLYTNDVSAVERKKILKEVIERNYNTIFDIYTDPKIKIFIQIAYYTKSYWLLDFVLQKLNKA